MRPPKELFSGNLFKWMESGDASDGARYLIPKSVVPGIHFGPFSMCVIASWGAGWDHVSVSWPDRTPSWDEMCWIKNMFFLPTETVIQYHPSEEDYVDYHPHCLHLWRPQAVEFPVPPTILVGPK